MRTITARMKAGHWALSRDEYEAVCEALDAGRLIVYPTETLYGLGCDPFDVPAVERVFEVKRRPSDQPIALALTTPGQLPRYARVTPIAPRAIAKHLPCPPTIRLKGLPG